MKEFGLEMPPLLSRATFDRADHKRDDTAALLAGWPAARLLLVDENGRYPITGTGHLAWVPATSVAAEPPDDAVFLGTVDGLDHWARRGPMVGGYTDPRRGAHLLEPEEAGLLTTALGMLNWHDTARFSPVDGQELAPARGGWVRRNPHTGLDEFPRTDPAVIMVIHDGADRVLLGRQTSWPDDWYSTLAGFVEPGESLEQCVLREVREEVGIVAEAPRYLGSQPWPFPRSLMLGFEAVADPEQPLDFVDGEIGDAHWFHRDQVLEALERNVEWTLDDPPGEGNVPLRLPGSISIARSLITAWARR